MRYILCVVEPDSLQTVISEYNLQVCKTFDHMVNMTTVDTESATAQLVQADPRVKYLRPDVKTLRRFLVKRTNRWNLSAVTRHTPTAVGDYFNCTESGAGVDAYIVDSGVNYTHMDLTGRAFELPGWTDPWGDNGRDGDGHGSHVAGLLAGTYSGVAPGARVYSVRVFGPGYDDVATASEFLTAINAVISHHLSKAGARPSVVNLSIGASPSSSDPWVYKNNSLLPEDDYLDDAVAHLMDNGITVCVAAGNGFIDDVQDELMGRLNASYCRPARVGTCITVGALNISWQIDDYSNYGSCVDIYAPGTDLISADWNSNSGFALMSGTSMATPVTAGACCLYLAKNPSATPAEVKNHITDTSVKGITNLATVWEDDPFLNGVALTNGITLQYTDELDQTLPLYYVRNDTCFNRVLHLPYMHSMSAVPSEYVSRVTGSTFELL